MAWLSETSDFNNASSQSLDIAVPASGFPPGHLLVLGSFLNGASLPSVTVSDTKSNTWNQDQAIFTTAGGSTFQFSCIVSTALVAGDIITISTPAFVVHIIGVIEEFGDMTSGSDVGTSGNSGSTSDATPSTGATATTSQANEIVVGVMGMVSPGRTYTPGAGYTAGNKIQTTSGSADRALVMQWKYVTSVGTQTSNGTFNSGALYGATVETYKIVLPAAPWLTA